MALPFIPTQLILVRPVPADVDFAQAAEIKPIAQVTEEAGIPPHEMEFYAPYNAKIKMENACLF